MLLEGAGADVDALAAGADEDACADAAAGDVAGEGAAAAGADAAAGVMIELTGGTVTPTVLQA